MYTPKIKGPEKWFDAGSPDYKAMGISKYHTPDWEAYDKLVRNFGDMRVQRNWWVLISTLLAITLVGLIFYNTTFRSKLIVVQDSDEDSQ